MTNAIHVTTVVELPEKVHVYTEEKKQWGCLIP